MIYKFQVVGSLMGMTTYTLTHIRDGAELESWQVEDTQPAAYLGPVLESLVAAGPKLELGDTIRITPDPKRYA